MKSLSLLVAIAAAVKVQDPLTRDQEARAVENEVTFRVVHMLDSDLMHPDDADHNAAKAAFQGRVDYSTGDFIKKLGPLDAPEDEVLKRSVGRINHPYFPYPKP